MHSQRCDSQRGGMHCRPVNGIVNSCCDVIRSVGVGISIHAVDCDFVRAIGQNMHA